MTFNIRYNAPRDGDNAWPHRREKVASVTRLHRPDLVGLQDVRPPQLRDLRELPADWEWTGLRGRAGTGERDEFVPILYRPARFELLGQGWFWLSETPGLAASKGWDAATPRIAVWCKLRDRRTHQEPFLLNAHLDHVGEQARAQSARLIMQRSAAMVGSTPAILVGDMNSLGTDPPYAIFTGAVKADDVRHRFTTVNEIRPPLAGAGALRTNPFIWHDALRISRHPHHGPTSTSHGLGELRPKRRIDYVFVTSTISVLQHAALTDRWDGDRWPSDHLPVLVEIELAAPP